MAEYAQLTEDLTKMIIGLSTGGNADSPDVAKRISVLEGLIESLKELDKEK